MRHTYHHSTYRGFTFVELMAAIAIIGILSSVALASLSGARERARDSKRVTALSEMGVALELYYNRCRVYPNPSSGVLTAGATGTGCSTTFGTYMSSVPVDPLSSSGRKYDYALSGAKYVLRASLEQNNAALTDDLDGTQVGLNCGANPEVSGAYYLCRGN